MTITEDDIRDAAKVCGLWTKYIKGPPGNQTEYWAYPFDWNPGSDYADCLRLARACLMQINFLTKTVKCGDIKVRWPADAPDVMVAVVLAAAKLWRPR